MWLAWALSRSSCEAPPLHAATANVMNTVMAMSQRQRVLVILSLSYEPLGACLAHSSGIDDWQTGAKGLRDGAEVPGGDGGTCFLPRRGRWRRAQRGDGGGSAAARCLLHAGGLGPPPPPPRPPP